MWFELALVRAAGGAGTTAYTVGELQTYLRQYPAAHYSRDGREPLLYVTVLLLSLQVCVCVCVCV